MSTNTKVLDGDGKEITAGSIVAADRHLCWSEFQGIVVKPHTTIEDDEFTVAVLFGTDVDSSHFNFRHRDTSRWDERYRARINRDDTSFLSDDDALKECPRIVYFRPKELTVQEAWSVRTLADRFFKRRWHTMFGLPKGVTIRSADYECFLVKCPRQAKKLAVFNVWGSIFPIHVCEECFSEVNGFCGDALPQIKVPSVVAKGQPLTIEVIRQK